jgi:energy-coupling factor transporter ATP-binding protein EcfA2
LIHRLDIHNFKAFERYTVYVHGSAYLAGPNNAGKSTIIGALRTCANMLRRARRQRPTDTFQDHGNEVLGFPFSSAQVDLIEENLRHEGRDLECRLVLRFTDRRTLTAVWPPGDQPTPYFYLQSSGLSVHTAQDARVFPQMGLVPVLSPLDQTEALLTPKYVRENLDGRLASRHLRNQLWLLQESNDPHEDLDAFISFMQPWLPELRLRDLITHYGDRDMELDLFYTEPGRRSEKEIVWAGDGIQIWLQLLLHVFRNRHVAVLILDEPDVFLHPDLQRRLVKMLDELPAQTIAATHSSEVLTEATGDSVVWIDRVRRRSISAPEPATLDQLEGALGTQFRLRVARALRSKVVVFVEGKDMKLLRHLATAVGADRFANEVDVAVVPLRGFDNWDRIEPFKWLTDDLLDQSVRVYAILDRDYRPTPACKSVTSRLKGAGVDAHVWRKKELESYLLVPAAIARLSGADEPWLAAELEAIVSGLENEVFARFSYERQRLAQHDHRVQALQEAKAEFDAAWQSHDERLAMSPPKEILSDLNKKLRSGGWNTLSFEALSKALTADEVSTEVTRILERIEDALA